MFGIMEEYKNISKASQVVPHRSILPKPVTIGHDAEAVTVR